MALTHLDDRGQVQMVNVADKPDTDRVAIAKGEITMLPSTLALIIAEALPKGNVLTTAQIAGIMAAKRTSELIPLCHPLLLTQVQVDLTPNPDRARIEITATVRTHGQTGAEMEALTAVSVSALTLYDMAKAAEKTMRIDNIRLVHKSGGQSGNVDLETAP